MEDYKEKYEQALDNFKKIKAANKDNKELVDFIEYEYPELKESEDERIRKAIIEHIDCKNKELHIDSNDSITVADAIAWLEKQGEQKSTWSEEDEKYFNVIYKELESYIAIKGYYTPLSCADLSWLKSLKNRYTWKPSDEQIKGIKCAIKTLQHQLNVGDKRLNSLYDDLKKLREE